MSIDCDVLVVGAGISGLTTAFQLAKRGIGVQVIDAAPRPGGVIGSERRDGLLYERGPNSILDTGPFITAASSRGRSSAPGSAPGAVQRRETSPQVFRFREDYKR